MFNSQYINLWCVAIRLWNSNFDNGSIQVQLTRHDIKANYVETAPYFSVSWVGIIFLLFYVGTKSG